jgi:spermidine synthase
MVIALATGAFSTLAQVVCLREVMVVLAGHELSIAVSLASWLLGVGLGALAGGRASRRSNRPEIWVAAALVLLVFGSLGSIAGIRAYRSLLDLVAGMEIPPAEIFRMCLLLITPVSVGVGLCFAPLLSWITAQRPIPRTASLIYAAEAGGAVFGGVIFTFFLAGEISSFDVIASGGGLMLLALGLASMVARSRIVGVTTGIAGLFLIVATIVGWSGRLELETDELRWRAQVALGRRVASIDTPYQHLDLAENRGQFDLYSNGSPVISFPDPWERAVGVHVAMTQAASPPRRVLLVGGGVADRIAAALAHDPGEVHYVSPDPGEIELIRPSLPDSDVAALADDRVQIHQDDGRRYVSRLPPGSFDLILVELPDPLTARGNRYFTEEFYGECRRALGQGGLLATRISGASTHLSDELIAPAASMFATLERVFAEVALWPGSEIRMYASDQPANVTDDPTLLAERWRAREHSIETMSEYRFESIFDPTMVAELRSGLSEAEPLPNTDLRPTAYFYGLVLWDERASGGDEPSPLWALRRANAWWVVVPLLLAALLRLIWPRRRDEWARSDGIWLVLTGGLTGLALEVVLLLVFQNAAGSLYSSLGLLVALFMVGLTAGTWISSRFCRDTALRRARKVALFVDLSTVAVAVTAPLIQGFEQTPLLVGIWLVAAGLCTGAIFPPAVELISHDRQAAPAAGIADAADHLGACLGALVVGVLIVPVAGLVGAALILASVKAISLAGTVRGLR